MLHGRLDVKLLKRSKHSRKLVARAEEASVNKYNPIDEGGARLKH